MKPIPYGRQHITTEDVQAVVEVLKADFLTQGPKISEFESAFANYTGAKRAVAVSNGTAALHLCAMALGVGPGQKVITSPITFAASANCVRYCGGEVVFADIDPDTYLLDFNAVKTLVENSPPGTYAGVIPVDFAGRAVDLEAFHGLCKQHGMWMIEDACHAPGGRFVKRDGRASRCGSGEFADLAIFSFHPVKHIASGEGGMITTDDETLYKRLLSLRSHGIVKGEQTFENSVEFANGGTSANGYPNWYMEMQDLGYNYRLTDFQAALGLSQLNKAEDGLERRREIARRYHEAFQDQTFILGQSEVTEGHAYHLYVIEVPNRRGLYDFLRENHVYAQIHYIPCHLMPYYREQGWKEGSLPKAEEYYKHCISLPMFPTLTDVEQERVIELIKAYYE